MQAKSTQKRPLTTAEIELIKPVFKDSIDYQKVYINNKKFLPFNMQNDNMVMAPNGQIYFPQRLYKADYSKESASLRHLFVHEMSHVWQYQLGYKVTFNGFFLHLHGILKKHDPYCYKLDVSSKLCDFNIEQQADIIADYFLHFHDCADGICSSRSGQRYRNFPNCYLEVLADFIANPNNKKNLPKANF